MIRKITARNIHSIKNPTFQEYAQIYANIEKGTMKTIETFGLPFAPYESQYKKKKKLGELREKGAVVRNNENSVYTNGISSACLACQTGTGSYTTYPSLKCHRSCYFCFNPNQDDYHFYQNRKKNMRDELLRLLNRGVTLKHLALTGGEPLLFKKETVEFFQLANEKTPETYTRLYTTGDLLDKEILQQLKDANLNEIRISIKMEDSAHKMKHILSQIELANQYINNVLVEMPVIPGSEEEMKGLLLELDRLNIFGINLLEFCFPLGNGEEFKKRGFKLKNPPYEVYYNYWYAGGLAIAGSEEACLELVDFALQNQLKIGVHYCSLENKFTGQIYQQNYLEKLDETYNFSHNDFFYKTAKVFGKDRKKILPILERNSIPYTDQLDYGFIQFSVYGLKFLKNKSIEVGISSNVVEEKNGEKFIREVGLDWTTTDLFEMTDLFEPIKGGEKIDNSVIRT